MPRNVLRADVGSGLIFTLLRRVTELGVDLHSVHTYLGTHDMNMITEMTCIAPEMTSSENL